MFPGWRSFGLGRSCGSVLLLRPAWLPSVGLKKEGILHPGPATVAEEDSKIMNGQLQRAKGLTGFSPVSFGGARYISEGPKNWRGGKFESRRIAASPV
eukprot:jgi/Botrbrau1/6184/Bobra.0344s0024.1